MIFQQLIVGAVRIALLLHFAETKSISSSTPNVLSEQDINKFQEDGVILVRQLISGHDLIAAQDIANEVSKNKLHFKKFYKAMKFQNWQSNISLANIAIHSNAAKIASELININRNSSQSLIPVRILKDAILSFAKHSTACGWHVDDKSFWPVQNDLTGINVWIALSPITVKQGGGLVVAKGSFKMKWTKDVIPIIHEYNTCALRKLNKEIHKKFETIKLQWDMQPGDAIIHDRWCFHRAENIHFKNIDIDDNLVLNRYSIRYMPENSKIVHLTDPDMAGKNGKELKMFPDLFPLTN